MKVANQLELPGITQRAPMPRERRTQFFYITHVDNVPSILSLGIFSHNEMEAKGIPYTPIYDKGIVSRRREKEVNGRKLGDYANIFINVHNPMLWRVFHEVHDRVAIISIRYDVIKRTAVKVADGNAAHGATTIFPKSKYKEVLSANRDDFQREFWNEEDGSKRRKMAEILVPDHIPPEYLDTVYVSKPSIVEELRSRVSIAERIVCDPWMFWLPQRRAQLTEKVHLVSGDLFFSGLQTLTVSVNTKGVMGKGLASRAKYQFPDVYVVYQDVCRSGKVKMGKPYLYKREGSLTEQLSDIPEVFDERDMQTWFLLFATKDDWKYPAKLEGILRGLQWLEENAAKEGVRSLAMPALGCGLGKLNWRDVGPPLCKSMVKLGIRVWIYLPAEVTLSDSELRPDFLLN